MSETAFCPGPSCQKVQPVLVGEDGGRRCGYCKRGLAMQGPPVTISQRDLDQEFQGLSDVLVSVQHRVEALEQWREGAIPRIVRRLESLERMADVVTALEDRVNGLQAVVASFKAAVPSPSRGKTPTPRKKVRR